MNVEINKEYYEGTGNGKYGTLSLVKVINYYGLRSFYKVKIIQDICNVWENKIDYNLEYNSASVYLFNTFNEALENFIKEMNLKDYHDLFYLIFEVKK